MVKGAQEVVVFLCYVVPLCTCCACCVPVPGSGTGVLFFGAFFGVPFGCSFAGEQTKDSHNVTSCGYPL